ncbi:MAG: type II secretion system protein [Acidobacteria bacterium]|nr:type II secretion system protein [Acidobacteriota bacterium]
MGALLVGLAAAGIFMSVALPVWSQAAQREREAELVFRGEQYTRAVALYQRTNPGAFPPDVETLIEERFLRREYRDPMVEHGEFRILHEADAGDPGGRTARSSEDRGGVIGVVSSSR